MSCNTQRLGSGRRKEFACPGVTTDRYADFRGRYQTTYWHDGKRHVADQTFPTKGDAQAHLSSVETDLHRGAWVDPSAGKVTFRDWAQRRLAGRADLRPVTRAKYQHMLDAHVVPTLGPLRLGKVTPSVVRAWYMDMRERFVTTGDDAYNMVRAIFDTARWWIRSALAADRARNAHGTEALRLHHLGKWS